MVVSKSRPEKPRAAPHLARATFCLNQRMVDARRACVRLLMGANRRVAAMFPASAKTSDRNTLYAGNSGASRLGAWDFERAFQGSNPSCRELPNEMCRAYDRSPCPTLKPTLSRAANPGVFALWVYAYGAIDSGLLSMVSRAMRVLPPRREDECIDC